MEEEGVVDLKERLLALLESACCHGGLARLLGGGVERGDHGSTLLV